MQFNILINQNSSNLILKVIIVLHHHHSKIYPALCLSILVFLPYSSTSGISQWGSMTFTILLFIYYIIWWGEVGHYMLVTITQVCHFLEQNYAGLISVNIFSHRTDESLSIPVLHSSRWCPVLVVMYGPPEMTLCLHQWFYDILRVKVQCQAGDFRLLSKIWLTQAVDILGSLLWYAFLWFICRRVGW